MSVEQSPGTALPEPELPEIGHRSQTREALRALLSNRFALFCLVILALVVFAGLFGRFLAPYPVNATDIPGRLQPPSTAGRPAAAIEQATPTSPWHPISAAEIEARFL